MKIPTWLNEGYAEILRHCALGQERSLANNLVPFWDLQKPVSFKQKNNYKKSNGNSFNSNAMNFRLAILQCFGSCHNNRQDSL